MIKTIKYLSTHKMPENLYKIWSKENPHNNGYASFHTIYDPKLNDLYSGNELNKWLLENGGSIGNEILIHSFW